MDKKHLSRNSCLRRCLMMCMVLTSFALFLYPFELHLTIVPFVKDRAMQSQTENLQESTMSSQVTEDGSEKRVHSKMKTRGNGVPSPKTNLAVTSTVSKKVDSDPNSRCALSWNPIGLNVTSYETENVTVIRPHNQANRTFAKVKPVYKDAAIHLNPDKFLLPVVTFGPNNQLIGFWEGIFVAITLNRTLVLPRFKKHFSDRQWKRGMMNKISPIHRVDTESLCKFVSCVTLDDFQKACNFKVDSILNIRYLKLKQVREIESTIRMRILPQGTEDMSSLSKMLVPRNSTSMDKPMLKFRAHEVKVLFNTAKRCVIHPFPFLDLRTHNNETELYNAVRKKDTKDTKAPPDVKLFANIMKNSQHPKYIREIAKDFISKEFDGRPYFTAHWRYNEGDYMAKWHCKKRELVAKRCAQIRKYTALDFAKRLQQEIDELEKKNITIAYIYIASPKSGRPMISQVSEAVKGKKWKIVAPWKLEKFLKDHYSSCGFVVKHFVDILSSIEMEVCARGVVFLGALGSTWTGNVRKSRIFQEGDNILNTRDYIFGDKELSKFR